MAISFGKQNSKYKQYGYPNLLLDFAKTKSLIESINKNTPITFTRASSVATYVGADGLIKRAATNLLLYSEQFDNAAWTKSGADIAANQIIAPDGKQTADEIRAKAITTSLGIYGTGASLASGTTYTVSTYLKYINHQWIWIRGDRPSTAWQAFDIQNGAVGNKYDSSGVISNPSIQDVGNGWYRVSFSFTTTASGTSNIVYTLGNGSTPTNSTVTTLGTERMGVWGAQLEEGTIATPYIKTTSTVSGAPRFDHNPLTGESLGLLVEEERTNAFTNSEDLSAAGLIRAGTGVTPVRTLNYGVAPDGTQTAERFVIDRGGGTTSGDFSMVRMGIISTTNQNAIWSFYAKSLSGNAELMWYGSTDFSATVNIETQTIGSDWVRLDVESPAVVNPSVNQYLWVGSRGTFGGDDDLDVLIWGVQAEKNTTFPTSYIPTEGSTVTRTPDIAAIQDADFSYTNLLSYSESFDVGWVMTGFEPVSANVITSPDGQMTADLLTPDSGVSNKRIYFSRTTPNDNVFSFYAKSNGWQYIGSNATNTNGGPVFDIINGTVARQGPSERTASIVDVGNGWYRCIINYLANGSNNYNIVFLDSDALFYQSTTATGNGTDGAYLWGAQLTATEYPVDYVSTRNLLTDSQDFERSTWLKSGQGSASTPSVTDDAATAPDGTQTADEISLTLNGGTSSSDIAWIYENTFLPASTTYTLSAWVKAKTASDVGKQVGFGFATYANITLTDSWQRVVVTQTPNSAATFSSGFRLRGTEANQSVAFYVWGAQLEPGSTATDYYRTTDVVGKKYPWFEYTEGTVFAEAQAAPQGFGGQLWFNKDQISNRGWSLVSGTPTSQQFYFRADDNSLKNETLASVTSGAFVRVVSAIDADDVVGSANGGTVQSASLTAYYVFNQLRLGHQYAAGDNKTLNGHIKRLAYWNTRKADSVLQGLTSGSFE